jgi:hypothetical protein
MSSSHEDDDIADIRLDMLSNGTPAPDLERQQEVVSEASPVDRSKLHPHYKFDCDYRRIVASCIVCLNQGKASHYAIPVPFYRVPDPEFAAQPNISRVTGFWNSEKFESDAAIYQRINEACFYYKGWWKRWLPFYGVKSVQKVKVRK